MEDGHCDIQKILDEEFNQVLQIIKYHIEGISKRDDLSLIQGWLEKLSTGISFNQKENRNRYLVELCSQIQDRNLKFPFNQQPSEGPLLLFPYDSPPCSQLQAEKSCEPTDKVTFRSANFGNTRVLKIEENISLPSTPTHTVCKLDISETNHKNDIKEELHKTDVEIPALVVIKDPTVLEKSKLKYEYLVEHKAAANKCKSSLKKKNKKNFIFKDDTEKKLQTKPYKPGVSSKSEVSEGSASTTDSKYYTDSESKLKYKYGAEHKAAANKRNSKRKSSSKKKNKKSLIFKDDPEKGLQTKPCKPKVSSKSEVSEGSERDLCAGTTVSKYNGSLKTQSSRCVCENSFANVPCDICLQSSYLLQDLWEVKEILLSSSKFEEYHKRWTTTLSNLNNELESSEKKNSELILQIQSMKEKLTKCESFGKLEQCQCQKQSLLVEHQKQFQMLQSHYKEHLHMMEEKFMQILNEKEHSFGEKVASLREMYEQKIVELSNDCTETMKDKECHIMRLESSLEDLCQKMRREVSAIKMQIEESNPGNSQVDSVAFLKDCIWKMDRLYKEAEKRHNRKIIKLKEKMSLKEKTIRLEMVTQRADIVARVTSKSISQIDNTLIQLEGKYKDILEKQRMQFLMEQQQDRNLISELKASLANNLGCR